MCRPRRALAMEVLHSLLLQLKCMWGGRTSEDRSRRRVRHQRVGDSGGTAAETPAATLLALADRLASGGTVEEPPLF